MGRPRTKVDLLRASKTQFEKLWTLIDSLDEAQQTAAFQFSDDIGKESHWKRDKNLRDVLIHLYEWHQLLLNWVAANQTGNDQPFLPAPYTWKTYGDMNIVFWENHQDTPYDQSKALITESHDKVMQLMETFADDSLFSKGYFSWTGGSTLGQYCISATVAHYDWAIKKIKAHIKALKP